MDKLLNPDITDKERKEAITDEYGVRYTKDGLKLINVSGNLETYTIKEETRVISESAFRGCKTLQSIVIPKGVMKIGSMAFNGCNNLTITCKSPSFKVKDGLLYSKEGELISCFSTTKDIIIPSDVTKIGSCAFEGCRCLETIEIPDSVIKISKWSFDNCSSLRSIEILNSVKEIDERAFERCTSLKSVVVSRKTKVNKTYDSTFKRTTKIRKKWL